MNHSGGRQEYDWAWGGVVGKANVGVFCLLLLGSTASRGVVH